MRALHFGLGLCLGSGRTCSHCVKCHLSLFRTRSTIKVSCDVFGVGHAMEAAGPNLDLTPLDRYNLARSLVPAQNEEPEPFISLEHDSNTDDVLGGAWMRFGVYSDGTSWPLTNSTERF